VVLVGEWFVPLASAAMALPANRETIALRSGDATVSACLAVADSGGPHPVLVVIHEWWGLNDWVKEQAQKFAALGYVILAVDLYRGKVGYDPNLAHELSYGLPPGPGHSRPESRLQLPGLPDRSPESKDRLGGLVHGERLLSSAGSQ
jgi:hypothetical protein